MTNDDLTETLARAIAEGMGDDFDLAHRDKPHWIETRGESGGRYRDINEPRQPDYLDAATAAIEAIKGAGYAIVPETPTEEMLEVGAHCASTVPIPHTAERIYRAMIQAAEGERG